MKFIKPHTAIFEKATIESKSVSYGIFGERVKIIDENNDFYFIEMQDGYKGFAEKNKFTTYSQPSTHFISVRSSLLFSEPDIKSPTPIYIPFGSRLTFEKTYNNKFVKCQEGYILKDHINKNSEIISNDYVDIAEKYFLGAPYLWGGRSFLGIDCSGLVQMSLMATGHSLPRDSKDQEKFLENNIGNRDYKRGDIIFWKGHVGIMTDPINIIHANAHHMMCVIEPLKDVIKRSKNTITSAGVYR